MDKSYLSNLLRHWIFAAGFLASHLAIVNDIAVAQLNSDNSQAAAATTEWQIGYELFQMLFEERGLRVAGLGQAFTDPQHSVVVSLDTRESLKGKSKSWGNFIEQGGKILVAVEGSADIQDIGVFYSGPITSRDPAATYQGFDDCLKIPINQGCSIPFDGVSTVVTNRSGWFLPRDDLLDWETIGSLPPNGSPRDSRSQPVLAVGKPRLQSANSHLIISTDASLFTNGMIWHGDNALFAVRICEALCDSQRNRVVFESNGITLTSYKSRLPRHNSIPSVPPVPEPPPQPSVAQMLKLASAIVRDVEDSNIANEALRQRPRSASAASYFRWLVIAAFVLLLLWAVRALAKNGTLQAIFLRQRRMRPAHELRQISSGEDYRQAASYLAREFCWELTASRNLLDWQAFLGQLQNRSLGLEAREQHTLVRVVDVACRGYQARLTDLDFESFGENIRSLRAKLIAGRKK